MRTSNNPGAHPNQTFNTTGHKATEHTQPVFHLSPQQANFLRFLANNDITQLSGSLKCIHDLAIYHSDLLFDEDEKRALYYIKMIWEEMDKMVE